MEINVIGIVGAGQMGSGIAQVAAGSGLSVVMHDIKDEFVERGFSTIEKSLGRLVKKEKISEDDKKAILGRIEGTTSLEDMIKADFVVEAATENENLKLKIFADLDGFCKEGSILSSNTLFHFHHQNCSSNRTARKSCGDALYEPGSHDETGRNHRRPGYFSGDFSTDRGSGSEDGKDSCSGQ